MTMYSVVTTSKKKYNTYIYLDGLVCSIAGYITESPYILASP